MAYTRRSVLTVSRGHRVETDQLSGVGIKIIVLHELKNDEGIRLFLQDTWESYVKVSLIIQRSTGD